MTHKNFMEDKYFKRNPVPTMEEVINVYLEGNGFDGLRNVEKGCSCTWREIGGGKFPKCEDFRGCLPGNLVSCRGCYVEYNDNKSCPLGIKTDEGHDFCVTSEKMECDHIYVCSRCGKEMKND